MDDPPPAERCGEGAERYGHDESARTIATKLIEKATTPHATAPSGRSNSAAQRAFLRFHSRQLFRQSRQLFSLRQRRHLHNPYRQRRLPRWNQNLPMACRHSNRSLFASRNRAGTTHTITGAIVGVGAARKVAAVRWNVASDVVIAWVLTMPAAALIGAVFYKLGELLQ
jgi:hypothetical protein